MCHHILIRFLGSLCKLLNCNALFLKGLPPHNYSLPALQEEQGFLTVRGVWRQCALLGIQEFLRMLINCHPCFQGATAGTELPPAGSNT